MAERPVPIKPVFLSASVPDPRRNQLYFKTGDSVAIRNAVIALATVSLPHTELVFGGHPAITPLVKWVADQLKYFDRVRMFQSMYFRDRYLKDIELFKYKEIEAVPGDQDASLLKMRIAMIGSEDFGAAFFIGGMEGVEAEYHLLKKQKPDVPCFPVYTTGAAARRIWDLELAWVAEQPEPLRAQRTDQLRRLRTKSGYAALFIDLLEEVSDKKVSQGEVRKKTEVRMADEDRRKHLEMIQGIVTRLAGNSFSIKGWAVALITVLGGLAAKDSDIRFSVMLLFPAICFWGLDAYYLRQEKLFRKLYAKVAEGSDTIPAFSMNTQPMENEVDDIVKVAASPTVRWIHIPIMVFVILLIVYAFTRPAVRPAEKTPAPAVSGAPVQPQPVR